MTASLVTAFPVVPPFVEAAGAVLPPVEGRDPPLTVRRLRAASRSPASRILLLHGLASSSEMWEPFVARADLGLEVWCADLPWGADPSGGWSRDPDVHHWVTRALAMVDKGVDVVIAHSFGANAVLGWLDEAEQCDLRAAVLVSPFYRASPDDFDWAVLSHYLNQFVAMLEDGVRIRSGGRLDGDLERAIALRIRDRIGPYGWMRFFETYLRAPSLGVERFDTPCLIVAGETDIVALPADSRALAAAWPNSQLEVLPSCGHFSMLEHPDRFAALLHGFLDSIPAGRP